MGLLSKKVPYPLDNFLLSACKITASSQGNGEFMEFICLHGADSISQKSPKFYLLTHYFTYSPKFFCQFVVLPIHQSFPLYGILRWVGDAPNLIKIHYSHVMHVVMDYTCIWYNIHLPAVNGWRPKLSRFVLVMASSKLPHVTPTFNCNHFSRVALKHSLSCIGWADATRSSTDDFSPSRRPISFQCLQ